MTEKTKTDLQRIQESYSSGSQSYKPEAARDSPEGQDVVCVNCNRPRSSHKQGVWATDQCFGHNMSSVFCAQNHDSLEGLVLPPLERPKIKYYPAHGSGFMPYYNTFEVDAFIDEILRRATEAEGRTPIDYLAMMRTFTDAFNAVQPMGAQRINPAALSAGLKAVLALAGVKGDWEK
jgi:hypothetical protein